MVAKIHTTLLTMSLHSKVQKSKSLSTKKKTFNHLSMHLLVVYSSLLEVAGVDALHVCKNAIVFSFDDLMMMKIQ